MKIIEVKSWDDFIKEVGRLNEARDHIKARTSFSVSKFLYRGQPDSSWKLETTLERNVGNNITFERYFNFVSIIKAKIESVTGKKWEIPPKAEIDEWCEQKCFPCFSAFPAYGYFIYLRHHGFPSPLLDWTRSPYIAAYFAMINASKDPNKDEKVSVYAYIEDAGIKTSDPNGPIIQSLGPYVTTHKRHYLQQSDYTICLVKNGGTWTFDCHENVVSNNQDAQDILWRIDIPASERCNFLSKLELMNINSFSLFETEDKLMEHIYISEILLDNNL